MNTAYDSDADAFYARFAPEGTCVGETREVAPGVVIDLDSAGHLVGIEVLSVTARKHGHYAAPQVLAAE